MTKFRLHYNKDKEAEFLNEMSQYGYAMTGFFAGFYSFDRCQPGEYIYQIDISEGFFRVSNNYREFMREMEVELVCLWGPWVVLRKRASDGPFVLYTDVESQIEHYEKIKRLFKLCTIFEIFAIFMGILSALKGGATSWGICFLQAAVTSVFVRELMRIDAILYELRQRTGQLEQTAGRCGRRRLSRLLAFGFFFNAIALLLPDIIPTARYEFWKGFFHGLAMVFFLVGALRMMLARRE